MKNKSLFDSFIFFFLEKALLYIPELPEILLSQLPELGVIGIDNIILVLFQSYGLWQTDGCCYDMDVKYTQRLLC